MRRVFTAIPLKTHSVHDATAISLMEAVVDGVRNGFTVEPHTSIGPPVHVARNLLAGHFLASECTDLFFVDSDISWDPGEFGKLVNHNVDIVCGAYLNKYIPDPVFNVYAKDRKTLSIDPETGLMEIKAAGLGFMRIRREVLEGIKGDIRFFDFEWDGDDFVGEDQMFCRLLRSYDHRIWLDPHLRLHHAKDVMLSARFVDHLGGGNG